MNPTPPPGSPSPDDVPSSDPSAEGGACNRDTEDRAEGRAEDRLSSPHRAANDEDSSQGDAWKPRVSNTDAVPVGALPMDEAGGSVPPLPASLPPPGLLAACLWAMLPFVAQMLVLLMTMGWINRVCSQWSGDLEEGQAFADRINVCLLAVGTLTSLLVSVAVARWKLGPLWVRRLGVRNLSGVHWCSVLLLVVPMAIVASEVSNCAVMLLERMGPAWLYELHMSNLQFFLSTAHMPWWFGFVAGCLLPGFGEEIYCRGFLSRGLVARYGIVWGTLLTAFLFGAMHLEPVQSLSAFVLGIGLQFVFLTTRSLLAPILVHVANNGLALLTMRCYSVFSIPGVTQVSDDGVVHVPPWLFGTALAALVMTVVLLYRSRTQWRLPDGTFWSPGYVSAEIPLPRASAQAVSRPVPRGLLVAVLVVHALLAFAIVISTVFPA